MEQRIEKLEKEVAELKEVFEGLANSARRPRDNQTINITVDAGELTETRRVTELFSGLRETVRKG